MSPSIRNPMGRIGAPVKGVDLAARSDPPQLTTLRSPVTAPYGVDDRRSEPLVDAAHHSSVLEVAA